MFQDRKDARTEYAYIIQYIHKHNILAQLLMIISFNKRRKKKPKTVYTRKQVACSCTVKQNDM